MNILPAIPVLLLALTLLNVPAQAGPSEISAQAKAGTAVKSGSAARSRVRVTVTPRYRGTPGYGFLPGYEPPPRRPLYGPQDTYYYPGTYPWYGWPGFYRGRWNGGGFGPCYTKTPIGPIWNCG